jgi:hypothetical protein
MKKVAKSLIFSLLLVISLSGIAFGFETGNTESNGSAPAVRSAQKNRHFRRGRRHNRRGDKHRRRRHRRRKSGMRM